jgi:hypothetical protein
MKNNGVGWFVVSLVFSVSRDLNLRDIHTYLIIAI